MSKRSPIDTEEYRRLRDVYYAKLADEGFQDVEIIDKRHGAPGEYLRGVSAGDLRRNSHRIRTVRETLAYYEACRARVHRMPEGIERIVWSQYAEGAKKTELVRDFAPLGLRRKEVERIVQEGHEDVLRRAKEENDLEGLE